MRVLVIGSGGREHALCVALTDDNAVTQLCCAPGNPGMAELAELAAVDATQPEQVAELARRWRADLVVIGPEAPLVAGVADAVRDAGIACFGPSAAAAAIEGSKSFAKQVMVKAGVPTAVSRTCATMAEATQALGEFGPPYVVKDDALAAGKGVVVTTDRDAALNHAMACDRVVIEQYLDGPEVSLFVITDGEAAAPLLPVQDFKRLGDADSGPNTGGMGAYCPLPWLPPGFTEQVMETLVHPTLATLRAAGTPFAGLLYVGIALTSAGPKVVEFNARFGDPEAQAVLPLLATPLGGVLYAAATGLLADHPPLQWRSESAVTVVLAAHGYPDDARVGDVISGPVMTSAAERATGTTVYHAGTVLGTDHVLRSSSGRVLAVTGLGADLTQARERAYQGVKAIDVDGSHFRTDIAAKAISGELAKALAAGTVRAGAVLR
ncbi:MAG: phosphoribosylamine--glycine ligase [Mycobacteriales bacterium]